MSTAERGWLPILLLLGTRIGAGICGATISTAAAVIADSTPKEHRSHGMAIIGAAFGIGFTFGPLMGLIKESLRGEIVLDEKTLATTFEIAWDAVTN